MNNIKLIFKLLRSKAVTLRQDNTNIFSIPFVLVCSILHDTMSLYIQQRVKSGKVALFRKNLNIYTTNVYITLTGKRFYSTNKDNINNLKPVVVYSNTDTQKELIFSDNKGKSGVYR